MKRAYSLETNHEISVGQVVEYLPGRNGNFIFWVKLLQVSADKVFLGSTHAGTAWHDPSVIGARIGNKKPSNPNAGRDMHGARAGVPAEQVIADEIERVTITKASATGKSEAPLPTVHTLHVTGPELDAILAGLRLLQTDLDIGDHLTPQLRGVYTNNDAHLGLSVEEIDALCERIN